jgi:4-hydroxy-tetrahydrodipicolinate reductase
MTRVAVSGAAGRMGRLVAEAVASADGLEFVAAYDPPGAGRQVAGITVSAEPEVVAGAEVVVEFSNPSVVLANVARWRRLGLHAVVGTSGFDEARLAVLRRKWGSGPPNCLVVPNFSVGAVLLVHFAAAAAPHFAAAEVVEAHHDRKADAPSGTALAAAAAMTRAGGRQDREVVAREGVPGVRGGRVEGVPVHSLRLPGVIGFHEVIFGTAGETLTIRHDITDRASFLPGVLLGIRRVGSLPDPVTVGLEGLLGLPPPTQ